MNGCLGISWLLKNISFFAKGEMGDPHESLFEFEMLSVPKNSKN